VNSLLDAELVVVDLTDRATRFDPSSRSFRHWRCFRAGYRRRFIISTTSIDGREALAKPFEYALNAAFQRVLGFVPPDDAGPRSC
jgi:hypothetical protein